MRRSEPEYNADDGRDQNKRDGVQLFGERDPVGKDEHQHGQHQRLDVKQRAEAVVDGEFFKVEQRELQDRVARRSDQRRGRGTHAVESRVDKAVIPERLQHARNDDDDDHRRQHKAEDRDNGARDARYNIADIGGHVDADRAGRRL